MHSQDLQAVAEGCSAAVRGVSVGTVSAQPGDTHRCEPDPRWLRKETQADHGGMDQRTIFARFLGSVTHARCYCVQVSSLELDLIDLVPVLAGHEQLIVDRVVCQTIQHFVRLELMEPGLLAAQLCEVVDLLNFAGLEVDEHQNVLHEDICEQLAFLVELQLVQVGHSLTVGHPHLDQTHTIQVFIEHEDVWGAVRQEQVRGVVSEPPALPRPAQLPHLFHCARVQNKHSVFTPGQHIKFVVEQRETLSENFAAELELAGVRQLVLVPVELSDVDPGLSVHAA